MITTVQGYFEQTWIQVKEDDHTDSYVSPLHFYIPSCGSGVVIKNYDVTSAEKEDVILMPKPWRDNKVQRHIYKLKDFLKNISILKIQINLMLHSWAYIKIKLIKNYELIIIIILFLSLLINRFVQGVASGVESVEDSGGALNAADTCLFLPHIASSD